ncbi:MAG: Clp protease N-terminal domain-containing protein, partial [Campylobacterota bacterium]|nr:Clp protease N-terminal domain-containing protein [Campylobacterota bacterium]
MGNQIFEKLTNQMQETVESGLSLALHNKNQEVEIIHIIWGLLTNTSSVLNQLLNKLNIDKTAIELETKSIASKLSSVSSVTKENIVISRNLVSSLENAQGLMASSGDTFLAVDTWIISNLSNEVFKNTIGKYVDLGEVKKELEA